MPFGGLRVGVIAPPWLPVPPVAYGGTELVIDALCVGLQRAGHDVILFSLGESTCPVPTKSLFQSADIDRMGTSVLELRHVAAAYDAMADVDVVHDHTLAGLFYHSRFPQLPVVTTNHGPFNNDLADLYRRVAGEVAIIAISQDQARRAPSDIPLAAVIHHGLDLDRYRFESERGDHVLFLGRMSPDKGVDTAIRTARAAGFPLIIAAKMREPGEHHFFDETIRPLLGDDVTYIGEADFATKIELLSTARALVNPIVWPEPFGLVMAEALACGTPVVGYGFGAAPEIVDHGVTGFLGHCEQDLINGLAKIDDIERPRCREAVEARFSVGHMVDEHVALYRRVLARPPATNGHESQRRNRRSSMVRSVA